MSKILFFSLLVYGIGMAQSNRLNNDLYFSVVQKDIEKTFNRKEEKDPLFRWSFCALKTFPVKNGESCVLPCCPEDKNYYNSIFYMVDGSLVHLIVGIRCYYIGENKSFYKAYRLDLLRNQSNDLMWKIMEVMSRETDRYE